jgi:hypothetical protein
MTVMSVMDRADADVPMRSHLAYGASVSAHKTLYRTQLIKVCVRFSIGCKVHGGRAPEETPMRIGSRAALAVVLMICAGSVQAGTEDEVKAQFSKFVAAQNAHDLKAVGDMLLDSPQFLWITRGAPIWSREAALKRFEALYQGTWSLEPKTDELKVFEIQPGWPNSTSRSPS